MSEHTPSTEDRTRLSRRTFVATGAAGVAALAGCLGGDDSDGGDDSGGNGGDSGDPNSSDGPPEQVPYVADPPDAVYRPTHRPSLVMNPMVAAGDYALLPHFSYPHRFWLVDGRDTEEVLPTLDDGAHMMLAFWDRETGELLPVDAGATAEIRFDGDPVETVAPWPMLSQTMGFHFGDNVPLPEDGTYTVEVTMNPIEGVRKTGAFEGRFEETRTATFEFEWSADRRRDLRNDIDFLDEDQWGEPGALEPMRGGGMNMGDGGMAGDDGGMAGNDGGMAGDDGGMNMGGEMPSSSLPPASEYPGSDLGIHTSGDAQFVVRYVEESRLATGGGGYLLVSPRTPHNKMPLPDMSLSLSGPDSDVELAQTLDDELGMHYGASVELSPGATLDLAVDAPPQIARHQGYETAFLDMPPVTVEVPA